MFHVAFVKLIVNIKNGSSGIPEDNIKLFFLSSGSEQYFCSLQLHSFPPILLIRPAIFQHVCPSDYTSFLKLGSLIPLRRRCLQGTALRDNFQEPLAIGNSTYASNHTTLVFSESHTTYNFQFTMLLKVEVSLTKKAASFLKKKRPLPKKQSRGLQEPAACIFVFIS